MPNSSKEISPGQAAWNIVNRIGSVNLNPSERALEANYERFLEWAHRHGAEVDKLEASHKVWEYLQEDFNRMVELAKRTSALVEAVEQTLALARTSPLQLGKYYKTLTTLTDTEENALRLRSGLNAASKIYTLKDAATRLGVSRQTVTKAEIKALGRLSKLARSGPIGELVRSWQRQQMPE